MSLSREAMLDLMALADGELEGTDKERVERLAAESDEARRVVDAMRVTGVRVWLADAMEERSRAAEGIADAVMARLEGTAMAGVSDPLPVARLAPRRSGAHSRQSVRATLVAAAVLGSALAMAAGVVMYMRSGERNPVAAPVASIRVPSGETSAPWEITSPVIAEESHASARGVEVEEIDSAARVSIFEISAIANASARSSVVVWIEDDPGEK